jgi:endonuclease YncB( thermonuclease family)
VNSRLRDSLRFLTLLLVLALAGLFADARGEDYAVCITGVHDGDTPRGDVEKLIEFTFLGRRMAVQQIERNALIRLDGVASPELSTAAGKLSRDWLASWLVPGTLAVLHTGKKEREKFGRPFGRLTVDGKDVSREVIRAGMGVPWNGKGKQP